MTIKELLKHSEMIRISIDRDTFAYWDKSEKRWIIRQRGKVVDGYNYEENLVHAILDYEDTGSFGISK